VLVVIATAERAATVTMNGQLTVLYTQDVAASPNLGTQTGFDPARLGPDWDRLTLSWAPDPGRVQVGSEGGGVYWCHNCVVSNTQKHKVE